MAKTVHENQYFTVTLNDKNYLRIYQKTGGAVVIPTVGDSYILIEHQRGDEVLLEFPRGFLEQGESHAVGGLRELKEELNLDGVAVQVLGELRTDSGLIQDNIAAVQCTVTGTHGITLQHSEGVLTWRLMPLPALMRAVKAGEIKDNFTLAALMLLLAQNA